MSYVSLGISRTDDETVHMYVQYVHNLKIVPFVRQHLICDHAMAQQIAWWRVPTDP